MDVCRSFLCNAFDISEEEIIQQLYRGARIEHYKKDMLLLEAGDQQRHLYFLVDGTLRGFVSDENGRDITDCFIFRSGEVIMGTSDVNKPSLINIETLCDCQVICLSWTLLDNLMEQNSVLLYGYTKLLQNFYTRHYDLKKILYQPAMQRYLWFLEEYPGLINSVCNKHIASFLGITPVTLSRLRRQLREEKGNMITDN